MDCLLHIYGEYEPGVLELLTSVELRSRGFGSVTTRTYDSSGGVKERRFGEAMTSRVTTRHVQLVPEAGRIGYGAHPESYRIETYNRDSACLSGIIADILETA